MFVFIAIVTFSCAYIDVAIRYLFSLVDTLSPINRIPVFILICSIVPVFILSLIIATDENICK